MAFGQTAASASAASRPASRKRSEQERAYGYGRGGYDNSADAEEDLGDSDDDDDHQAMALSPTTWLDSWDGGSSVVGSDNLASRDAAATAAAGPAASVYAAAAAAAAPAVSISSDGWPGAEQIDGRILVSDATRSPDATLSPHSLLPLQFPSSPPRQRYQPSHSQGRRPLRDLTRFSFLSLSRSSISSNYYGAGHGPNLSPTAPETSTIDEDAAMFPAARPAAAASAASVPDAASIPDRDAAAAATAEMEEHRGHSRFMYRRHQKQFSEPLPDQQRRSRQHQHQQQLCHVHRPTSSKSHISKYLRGRITPDSDRSDGRSLDSFPEKPRRLQKPQPQSQSQSQRRYSVKLPIMPTATPMTQVEFEALPQAVQRKYFSTLERLRIARNSGSTSTEAADLDPLRSCAPLTSSRPPTPPHRPAQHARLGSDLGPGSDSFSLSDPAAAEFYAKLPEKIQRRHLTSEEQVIIAKHLRKRFILDPTDEILYKRRYSRVDAGSLSSNNSHHHHPYHYHPQEQAIQQPSRPSTAEEAMPSVEASDPERPAGSADSTGSPGSIYNTFRWLDDDEDIDLRLYLDDYHANLRDDLELSTRSRRPSFRRHVSITRVPFGGRSPVTMSRAPNDEATATDPLPPPVLSSPPTPPPPIPAAAVQARRSRTLSLITPRHISHESILAPQLDVPAAHYQDPEARLKLRVYLASPQKFDEAIEFGFPSTDTLGPRSEYHLSTGRQSRQSRKSRQIARQSQRGGTSYDDNEDDDDNEDTLQTFLADDKSSTCSHEAGSDTDPDSPSTPQTLDENTPSTILLPRPHRAATDPFGSSRKGSCEYLHTAPSSREMTLRMTLTRPDLRAADDQIYGWQKSFQARKSHTIPLHSTPLRGEMITPPLYASEPQPQLQQQQQQPKQPAGLDHWDTNNSGDRGVIRRLWNKVRRQ